MADYTIFENYTLPSKGLVYDNPINPNITLRSMTVEEEMRRLAPSDMPYKVMCDIIESCLVDKLEIPVYDLCLGDYEFLLHKLRVVTYGSDYKITVRCPNCNNVTHTSIDLDELEVKEYDEEKFKNLLNITLPQSNKIIKLNYQTPRMLDKINLRRKELLKKNPDIIDPSLRLTLESLIKTIDGEVPNPAAVETFVKKLPMKDAQMIIQTADKLKREVGLDTLAICKCKLCGFEFDTTFRLTSEFFGPAIYE